MTQPVADSPVLVTPEVAAQIAKGIEGLTAEQVSTVLAAWNAARDGEPVGTVRRDPATGRFYIRVDCDGIHMWRVVDPANGLSNEFDQESTKPFDLVLGVEATS